MRLKHNGWSVRVLACAVVAACMLCMQPRGALAYSSYEIPCQYSGHVTVGTGESFPSGMYGASNYREMSFSTEYEYGKATGQNWNGTELAYYTPLTMHCSVGSTTAQYSGYVYGSTILTFGGRNIAIGGLYKNLVMFWPRGSGRFNYYVQYDTNNTLNQLYVDDLDVVPTSYGWYGRTSDESSDSWHVSSTAITDFSGASRLYAVGMLWRTNEQVTTKPQQTTSSSGDTHYINQYYMSLLERPAMMGYVEDTDMVNAINGMRDSINANIDDELQKQTNSITSYITQLDANIRQQTQSQTTTLTNEMDYTNTVIRDTTVNQTEQLKSTNGSSGILTGQLGGGEEEFKGKIGLLGQLGQVTDKYMDALQASPDGTVHFPGINVLGHQILQPADYNIWSNGLSEWRDPCRAIVTFCFIVAWVNGMWRVLDYQILGQHYDGTDEP